MCIVSLNIDNCTENVRLYASIRNGDDYDYITPQVSIVIIQIYTYLCCIL